MGKKGGGGEQNRSSEGSRRKKHVKGSSPGHSQREKGQREKKEGLGTLFEKGVTSERPDRAL